MTKKALSLGHRWKLSLLILILSAAAGALSAQPSALAQPGLPLSPESGRFRIAEVRFEIEGHTMESALRAYLDIRVGKEFASPRELEDYVITKERLLRSNTIFDLSSTVRFEPIAPGYPVEPKDPADPADIRIVVLAKDSWTILAVPFPKYSVDDGFQLALRYKDFNFLGTLNALTINLDEYFELNRTVLGASFGVYPFMLGNTWSWSFDGSLRYDAPSDIDLDAVNVSIGSDYPAGEPDKTWTISPGLSYVYDIDDTLPTLNATVKALRRFGRGQDWSFSATAGYQAQKNIAIAQSLTNDLSLAGSIPLLGLPSRATLSLNPGLSASFDMELPGLAPLDPTLGASLGLGYSAVDWIGSFRRGSSANLSASYTRHRLESDPVKEQDIILTLDSTAFFAFRNLFGVNFRLSGRWDAGWTMFGNTRNYDDVDWGTYVRGIAAASYGDLALIANLEFPLNFAQGQFFTWSKLEAEVLATPFVDAGILRADPTKAIALSSDGILCAGFELAVFPRYARSFIYRLSLGYDLLDFIQTGSFDSGKIEGWLGLGLHF